jgi:hypothetical protein
MTEIRLGGIEGSRSAAVVIEAEREDSDWRLTVVVRYHAFEATVDTLVVDGQWRAFVSGVDELDRTRRGSVRLESLSPGELALELGASDALGHISIHGEVGVRHPHQASLRFGHIALDPSDLPGLSRLLRSTITKQTGYL